MVMIGEEVRVFVFLLSEPGLNVAMLPCHGSLVPCCHVAMVPWFLLFSFVLFRFQVRPERCRRVWVGASDQQEEVSGRVRHDVLIDLNEKLS